MSLIHHRATHQTHQKGAQSMVQKPKLQCLQDKLLKHDKNITMAMIVRDNEKNRIQFVRGTIISFRKSKTEYLTKIAREGTTSSRKVTITRMLSLHNPELAFAETKDHVFL